MRVLILCLLGLPAAADEWCDDVWFARNAVYAEAGHCFASPLGQAVFGRDCEGERRPFTPREEAVLALIAEGGDCPVDTSRARALTIEHLSLRLNMGSDQPVRSFESACLGYGGPEFVLRLGARADAAEIIRVPQGSNVLSSHDSAFDGWGFYEVELPTGLRAAGWTQATPLAGDLCRFYAG